MAVFSDLNILTSSNGVAISRYSNFRYDANNLETEILHLNGDWFVIDGDCGAYSHFIYDSIGQYYAIKTIVPDLKPLILVPSRIARNHSSPDFLWWCIDKLLLEPGAVVIDPHPGRSFVVEKLYVASTELIAFFQGLDINQTMLMGHDEYQDFVLPELRRFFLDNLKVGKASRKIYMSRRSKSDQLGLEKEYIEYLKDNQVSWDPVDNDGSYINLGKVYDPNNILNKETLPTKFKNLVSWDAPPAYVELEVNTRYMSEEDESKLESFFEKAGYEILIHDDLSYEEQMSTIATASHFATLVGSAVLNSVVCRDNASVYVLSQNAVSNRSVNLDYLPTVLFNNSYSVFSYKEYPGETFSIDQIIEKLEELGV